MLGNAHPVELPDDVNTARPAGLAICQHEARGADLAIISAIDAHIETAKASQGQPSDGTPQVQLKSGPLVAHGDQQEANELESHVWRGR